MPAADARLTDKNFPTPETFSDYSIPQLLTAAAYGRIGFDQRLAREILEKRDRSTALADIVRFATEPFPEENTANLTRALFVLLRHFRAAEAMPFLSELLVANIEELPEELIEAVLEVGPAAVEPVLKLYDKLEDDELRGEIAFLLASFRNRDPRILERLLDHFEYDAADGAIILQTFGDPAAIPAIEKVLAEPNLDEELKKELTDAVAALRDSAAGDDEGAEASSFDAVAEFPASAGPLFDVITDAELAALLDSPSAEFRLAAVDSLSSSDMTPQITDRVRKLAESDPDPKLRGMAWEALAVDPDDKKLVGQLVSVTEDAAKTPQERVGALVGLASLDKYAKLKTALLEFHQSFPEVRAQVLKAMWRSLDRAFAKYMVEGLAHEDLAVREQAVLGIGNLSVSSEADKLEALFEDEALRPSALYAYALAAPGETTRARMKSLFNRIEKLADGLDEEEAELVEAALDQRLAYRGLKPVFHVDEEDGHDHHHHHHVHDENCDHDHEHHHAPAPAASAAASQLKAGRNDPCPCGSGKKYKKCHGA